MAYNGAKHWDRIMTREGVTGPWLKDPRMVQELVVHIAKDSRNRRGKEGGEQNENKHVNWNAKLASGGEQRTRKLMDVL